MEWKSNATDTMQDLKNISSLKIKERERSTTWIWYYIIPFSFVSIFFPLFVPHYCRFDKWNYNERLYSKPLELKGGPKTIVNQSFLSCSAKPSVSFCVQYVTVIPIEKRWDILLKLVTPMKKVEIQSTTGAAKCGHYCTKFMKDVLNDFRFCWQNLWSENAIEL